jgi:hypothetical protein
MHPGRPVDTRPASVGCSTPRTVLCGTGSGTTEVGVHADPAIPTADLGSEATMVAPDTPTPGARPRRVPKGHPAHDAAALLGRVGAASASRTDALAGDTAGRSTGALRDPCADVRAGGDGGNDLPTALVVRVAPEPTPGAYQPPTMPTNGTTKWAPPRDPPMTWSEGQTSGAGTSTPRCPRHVPSFRIRSAVPPTSPTSCYAEVGMGHAIPCRGQDTC